MWGVVRGHQRAPLAHPFVLCTDLVKLGCKDLDAIDANVTRDLGPKDDDVVRHIVDVGRNDATRPPVSRPEAYFVQGYPSKTLKLEPLGTVGIVFSSRGR